MDVTKYLYVYTNVFFVKGYLRTMIYDICAKRTMFVNSDYYVLLEEFRKNKIKVIQETYPKLDVEAFCLFLINNKLASLVDDLAPFSSLAMEWQSPNEMENAIIDIMPESHHDFGNISVQLQGLNCAHLEIRIFYPASIQEINGIVKHFYKGSFNSIDVIVRKNKSVDADSYLKFARTHTPTSLFVYNAPTNYYYKSQNDSLYPGVGFVYFLKQNIDSTNACGIINRSSFVLPPTIHDFIEGIVRNKCLNKKLAISADGEIRNCPCMSKSYGNIKNISLKEIFQLEDFQKFWFIKKDEIKVCKDCEYRYICNDCRAFISGTYDKPLKCKYNPYKQVWEA